jgi:hypothetical protein
MCHNTHKTEAYEQALLEIVRASRDPKRAVSPAAIAETVLDQYRKPVDLNLLGVDLAAGETVEEEVERRR